MRGHEREHSDIVQCTSADLVTCISLYDGRHVSHQRQHHCMCMGLLQERGEGREREGREEGRGKGGKREGRKKEEGREGIGKGGNREGREEGRGKGGKREGRE